MTREQLLLIQLMEECAEVSQAASKALRFGLQNHHPESEKRNWHDLACECAELLELIQMLESERIISGLSALRKLNDKKARIEYWLEVSKGCGILEEVNMP